jgi:hypothetical protein
VVLTPSSKLNTQALLLVEIYFAPIEIQNNIDRIGQYKHPKKISNSRSFKLVLAEQIHPQKDQGILTIKC